MYPGGPDRPSIMRAVLPAPPTPADQRRDRLGAFIHHDAVSVGIAALIIVSVGLTLLHLHLPHEDPRQHPIELVNSLITLVFVVELSIKAYVADSWRKFLAQYWVDIIAVIPWAHSLRILRILRLLRVFRAALILSRRVRLVSGLLRSAIGEYLVLAMILVTLLTIGSFGLYLSERAHKATHGADADPSDDLDDPVNAAWATVFFIVANEPMISAPRSPVGKGVTLAVMFGGLTTFAVFTGVVSALMVNRLRRRTEIDDMDRFQLTDHLVVCGWNKRVPQILEELSHARSAELPAVVIVAELEELPAEVTRLPIAPRVYLIRGDSTTPALLEQARIAHARRAIIVADDTRERPDQDRDARTVLAALMVERMNPRITSCAELLNRDNEVHVRAAGVEEVVATPEAGGQHLAMAALHPGLADVVSELISARKGPTLIKEPIPPALVGQTFGAALEQLKRTRNAILLGVEAHGRQGSKAPGYKVHVNPPATLQLAVDDNLFLIIEH